MSEVRARVFVVAFSCGGRGVWPSCNCCCMLQSTAHRSQSPHPADALRRIRPLQPDHAPCQQDRIRRFFLFVLPIGWPVEARRITFASDSPRHAERSVLSSMAFGPRRTERSFGISHGDVRGSDRQPAGPSARTTGGRGKPPKEISRPVVAASLREADRGDRTATCRVAGNRDTTPGS